jgi:hypothetical protein
MWGFAARCRSFSLHGKASRLKWKRPTKRLAALKLLGRWFGLRARFRKRTMLLITEAEIAADSGTTPVSWAMPYRPAHHERVVGG